MSATRKYWRGRHVVYRLFDRFGRLLYIGRTNNLPKRLDSHSQLAWWFPLSARVRVQVHPDRESSRLAEESAISNERPAFNRVGSQWIGKDHWTLTDRALHADHADRRRHLTAVPA